MKIEDLMTTSNESFAGTANVQGFGTVDSLDLDASVVQNTHSIANSIGKFLVDSGLGSESTSSEYTTVVGNESMKDGLAIKTKDDYIAMLKDQCGIEDEGNAIVASEQLLHLIHKSVGRGSQVNNVWNEHNKQAKTHDNTQRLSSLHDILPESSVEELNMGIPVTAERSDEEFGFSLKDTTTDLKTAMTVSVMAWHTRLSPKVLATRPTPSPTVSYKREETLVIDLYDTDAPEIPAIELYKDPIKVENNLKTLTLLKANDTDGGLISDGLAKFGKTINVLKLSIDANKHGFDKINRTDNVDDSVKVKEVIVKLTQPGSPDVVEDFAIAIPDVISRFGRVVEGEAYKRSCHIEYAVVLKNGATTAASSPSAILTGMGANEGIKVKLNIMGSVMLNNGDMQVLGSVEISAHSETGEALTGGTTTLFGTLADPALVGYVSDQKATEQNVRKSDISVKKIVDTLSVGIPAGRNYIIEFPIGASSSDAHAAALNEIIGIGQDSKNLNTILDVLSQTQDLSAQMALGNPAVSKRALAKRYIAGCKVLPYVFAKATDVSTVVTAANVEKLADRSGDIKQYVQTMLNGAMTEVLEKTFYQQQLPNGANPVFRTITTGAILGNLLSAKHIHNHLEAGTKKPGNGIEYRLVLDNGVELDIVTSTFNMISDKAAMFPALRNNKTDILNFAHLWDFGTLVAQYVSSGGADVQRFIASSRELLFPTNPIGALLEFTGLEGISFTA